MTKLDLYELSLEASNEFLAVNEVKRPVFMTYEEAGVAEPYHTTNRAITFLRRFVAQDDRTQGSGTGLYYDGHVFVNIPRTATPVREPGYRAWSWPGWKTDRTAVGVVAHEVGHYVEDKVLGHRSAAQRAAHRTAWFGLLKRYKRQVSGYEPVPAEAWAETMRLFILNPDLLQRALPERYGFILGCDIKPVTRLLKKGWRKVLSNLAYEPAAERWIGVKK